MDFGLARTIGGDGMTQTGALLGTIEYMSPEQSMGKTLDQRSDIFAIGLIFYELLWAIRRTKRIPRWPACCGAIRSAQCRGGAGFLGAQGAERHCRANAWNANWRIDTRACRRFCMIWTRFKARGRHWRPFRCRGLFVQRRSRQCPGNGLA